MIRTLFAAILAVLIETTPAHAAIFSFDFGVPGQTSGTVTYDSVLGGPGFAPNSRLVTATFSNLYLNGTAISNAQLRGNVSQAGPNGGGQLLIFNQFFTSPFFPSPGFSPAFSIEFAAAGGGLFSSDGVLSAPGVMANYFVSGSAGIRPGEAVTFALAVPEPAVWGMMIIGIAGIGASMRRRGSAHALPLAA